MKTISKITAYMPNGVKIYEVGKGIYGEKVYKYRETITEIRDVSQKNFDIYVLPAFSIYVGGTLHTTIYAANLTIEYEQDE